jgi:hypothetical protein
VTASTRTPRPEHVPVTCGLPAVGAFTAYCRPAPGSRDLQTLATFPFCRFCEQPQRAAARQVAEDVPADTRYGAYPTEYAAGQSRVACTGERNPLQLGAWLDAERINAAADAARAALRELTHLTSNAYGHHFEVGNETAVAEALIELAADVEDELGTVARRLASRNAGGWHRVAESTHGVQTDDNPAVRDHLAAKAWRRWGGGPGDEHPPPSVTAGPEGEPRNCDCGSPVEAAHAWNRLICPPQRPAT